MNTFLVNDYYTTVLFDSGADFNCMFIDFDPCLESCPKAMSVFYKIEVVNG